MARDRANINTNIWTDTHWRLLTSDQQWLYTLILTHPELSYAGVADWRPGRLMQFAAGKSRQDIERIGAELQAERFIFIDEDTEEVLVRSFTRHDGLLKQPKLTVSMVNAYGAIASNSIREVFIHELRRLHSEQPTTKAFESEKVQALLRLPARPMQDFTPGFTPELTLGFTPNASQAQALPTTTATTTTTSAYADGGVGEGSPPPAVTEKEDATPRRQETKLPQDWTPTKAHWDYARENRLNLEAEVIAFRGHAETHDRRVAVWNSAFATWLRKAKPAPTPGSSPWDRKGLHT